MSRTQVRCIYSGFLCTRKYHFLYKSFGFLFSLVHSFSIRHILLFTSCLPVLCSCQLRPLTSHHPLKKLCTPIPKGLKRQNREWFLLLFLFVAVLLSSWFYSALPKFNVVLLVQYFCDRRHRILDACMIHLVGLFPSSSGFLFSLTCRFGVVVGFWIFTTACLFFFGRVWALVYLFLSTSLSCVWHMSVGLVFSGWYCGFDFTNNKFLDRFIWDINLYEWLAFFLSGW